jgi:hypothetical protein
LAELAACLKGLSQPQQDAIQTYLLCEIANTGGGGGSADLQAADYSGVAPGWTPTGTLGIAVDTVTEQIWWYYSGTWH